MRRERYKALETFPKANVSRKPWEESWEIIDKIGGGGQGTTSVVKRRVSDDDDERYVLKTLHKQKDPERRRRMHREVQALQQLAHPRLPKIIDSNTDAFEDLDVPLFFVMDYIDGQTLEEKVTEAPLKPDEAIALAMELSDVVSAAIKTASFTAISSRTTFFCEGAMSPTLS